MKTANRPLTSINSSELSNNLTDITVLYARLSADDGSLGDSNSIINQKNMLETFAQDNGMKNLVFFVDDGISGTTFKRPAFEQAIELVNKGRVKNFIVKDLSRFGRDYLKVGMFTEMMFPEKDIRFIAINDNVDSNNEDDNTLAPFRNMFNEWYARDCSKKIKAVKHAKGNAGEKMCANPPYGYFKDPENKKKWIVDDMAAKIVKRIFSDYKKGFSLTQIAKQLKQEQILTPSCYKNSLGIKARKIRHADPCFWNVDIVGKILARQEYCGHTVNFKTYKKSYKTKKLLFNPEEKRKVFYDTHEAIIDQETFDLVQTMRKAGRRRRTKHNKVGLFSGIAHCVDCGSRHLFSAGQGYYACAGSKSRLIDCNNAHGISEKTLSKVVLDDFNHISQFVANHEKKFVENMQKQFELSNAKAMRQDKQVLEKAKVRFSELDNIIQKLYEDNLNGKISDDRFMKLSDNYEKEQTELKLFIEKANQRLDEQTKQSKDISQFVGIVKKYFEPKELTPEMMRELIGKIELGQPEKIDGVRHQTVKIRYRFVDELTIN
ncbi:recombinase family protein [Enterococcus wangshanyuanii]|uniref:Recombinase n=1 Tax=Enterococcus wangshanyuanii TaxID=2005703 RepID=A0ABQ1PJH9_9ENTE|nr:recombinase family protein [Enterococcus wangshanyuanii]GGC97888.1 recombinase [Enterococcus wangshanyuanii]